MAHGVTNQNDTRVMMQADRLQLVRFVLVFGMGCMTLLSGQTITTAITTTAPSGGTAGV